MKSTSVRINSKRSTWTYYELSEDKAKAARERQTLRARKLSLVRLTVSSSSDTLEAGRLKEEDSENSICSKSTL